MTEIGAVAEVWASIDGRLEVFRHGRDTDDIQGHYEGYIADAKEFIDRLKTRGYQVMRVID